MPPAPPGRHSAMSRVSHALQFPMAMRITNNILQRNAVAALQASQRRVAEAQTQANTGMRFTRASEDPVAASESMRSGGSLRALEQYRRNIQGAIGKVGAEEVALDSLTKVIERAQELTVQASSDTVNAQGRLTIKAEVDQLIDQALALGNTEFGGAYLFGGEDAATMPFTKAAPPAYFTVAAGAQGEPKSEIGAGQFMSPVHSAAQVFSDTGVLAALRDLSLALGSNDTTGIRGSLPRLDDAHSAVQSLLGEVGARTNQLEVSGANLDSLEVTLRTYKSDLEEIDLEEALTELVGRQTAYQAAMMSTTRVLQMNLTDYLR